MSLNINKNNVTNLTIDSLQTFGYRLDSIFTHHQNTQREGQLHSHLLILFFNQLRCDCFTINLQKISKRSIIKNVLVKNWAGVKFTVKDGSPCGAEEPHKKEKKREREKVKDE